MEAHGMAGHVIRRLHQSAVQIFVSRARDAGFDITPVQFAALDALHAHPGIDQASVAAFIAYDRVTIGGVIDRLVTKGWVQRTVSERDRRARVVALTPEGETIFEAILPIVRMVQDEILGRLSSEEQSLFLALAEKALAIDDPDDTKAVSHQTPLRSKRS